MFAIILKRVQNFLHSLASIEYLVKQPKRCVFENKIHKPLFCLCEFLSLALQVVSFRPFTHGSNEFRKEIEENQTQICSKYTDTARQMYRHTYFLYAQTNVKNTVWEFFKIAGMHSFWFVFLFYLKFFFHISGWNACMCARVRAWAVGKMCNVIENGTKMLPPPPLPPLFHTFRVRPTGFHIIINIMEDARLLSFSLPNNWWCGKFQIHTSMTESLYSSSSMRKRLSMYTQKM